MSNNRLIVLTADQNLGTGYVPPTPDQILAAVLDPNHAGMISSGLYNAAQVSTLRANALQYFKTQFGLDFSVGVTYPNGIIAIGG